MLQGFLKIAEVDAQGKPQKLGLKTEIRKAMSLPGNSALMVCHVPQVGIPALPMTAGDITPLWIRGTKSAVQTTEKGAKTTCNITPAEAQQSPIAFSDVSNLHSFGNNASAAPPCTDVSPAAAVTSVSSPNLVCADLKVKTYVRGSSCKLSANPTPSSKTPSAKSNRTLRFAGVDTVLTIGTETVGDAGPLVSENSGPVLKLCTGRIIKEKVSPTSSIETVSDVESREPFRSVHSTCMNDVVAPVKKRPWKRTQCDKPSAAVAIQDPRSPGSGTAFISWMQMTSNRAFLVGKLLCLYSPFWPFFISVFFESEIVYR